MNRRTFLGLSVGFAVGGTIGVADAMDDTYTLSTTELKLALDSLPAAFEGYRIAFISDAHLNVCTQLDFLSSIADRIREFKPDLVLHGGDYLWRINSTLSKAALSLSRRAMCFSSTEANAAEWYTNYGSIFEHVGARDGSFGVLGNHDGGIGKVLCQQQLATHGIKILINEHVVITRGKERLRVIGYDDYWTGLPSTPALPKRERGKEARVVLSHNPDLFGLLIDRENLDFDLGLAGHTHGGQIKLPGIGALFYNVKDLRFREGLWNDVSQQNGSRYVFTSRGLGTVVVPLRVGCPPELTFFTLIRK